VTDGYGLVYTLNADVSLIDPASLSIDNSSNWLGDNSNLWQLVKPFSTDGYLDVGAVRFDHQPVTGYGTIGILQFTTSVTEAEWLHFTFSNVIAISEDGQEIAVGYLNDSIQINSPLAVNQPDLVKNDFQIYPNPSNGFFQVELVSDQSDKIQVEIIDALGKVAVVFHEQLMSGEKKVIPIDISSFANGCYAVRVKGSQLFSERKILLSR
jgi:hypothetical protein